MRHITKAAAVLAILAMAAAPALAGPGCGAKASSCGAKGAKAKAACSSKTHQASAEKGACTDKIGTCNFVKTLSGGACCPSGTKMMKVEVVETSDGFIAVASANNAHGVKAIQNMAHSGWESMQKAEDVKELCSLCNDFTHLMSNGTKVQIHDTESGVVIVASSPDQNTVKGLHTFVAKIQPSDKAETKS
ncbi:MAG: hypothetical protein GF355_06140 [Candidatus Eisenbacteria bacterium]|nr:hypothetical protein [Candidatus Eisenbacteria bacterium]